MIILTLRTDKPEAEIGVYDDEKQIAYVTWQAHRQLAETLHSKIRDLLSEHGKQWTDIQGIICFEGPGSFTGLRIGLSVANALAASIPAAIVGATGNEWVSVGIQRLLHGENQRAIVPEYGAPVHITQQKK